MQRKHTLTKALISTKVETITLCYADILFWSSAEVHHVPTAFACGVELQVARRIEATLVSKLVEHGGLDFRDCHLFSAV